MKSSMASVESYTSFMKCRDCDNLHVNHTVALTEENGFTSNKTVDDIMDENALNAII